ncbi:DUF1127 domain-containing protein [Teichococcus oryzae]|uniref:DUF1127 domain-containing protein n=1 Tax=Teichococcus oryzae TaxID=1608942 RepID=A0A5B2TGV2_9PROT|nr:DUF1127 domain-containing protein [Pseudoroseomonas oryzae]KAA2213010.1 DUF1127 domain-containing protein [Pseudoroseomonas oryzae]
MSTGWRGTPHGPFPFRLPEWRLGLPLLRLAAAAPRQWRGMAVALAGLRRRRDRRRLAELDARMLRDIGADPVAARREARKWWWQR